jgi:hypothetical protein
MAAGRYYTLTSTSAGDESGEEEKSEDAGEGKDARIPSREERCGTNRDLRQVARTRVERVATRRKRKKKRRKKRKRSQKTSSPSLKKVCSFGQISGWSTGSHC